MEHVGREDKRVIDRTAIQKSNPVIRRSMDRGTREETRGEECEDPINFQNGVEIGIWAC